MQMVWGKFVVTEGDIKPEQQKLELEKTNLPQGTCGGGGTCGGSCGRSSCGCSRIKGR